MFVEINTQIYCIKEKKNNIKNEKNIYKIWDKLESNFLLIYTVI